MSFYAQFLEKCIYLEKNSQIVFEISCLLCIQSFNFRLGIQSEVQHGSLITNYPKSQPFDNFGKFQFIFDQWLKFYLNKFEC